MPGAAQDVKYSLGEGKLPRAAWVSPGPNPFFLMSSFFNLNPLKKSFTFPFSRHLDVKNFALIFVCTYAPFTVYSFTTASHLSQMVFFEWISMTVELGKHWVSKVFTDLLSFSHNVVAARDCCGCL